MVRKASARETVRFVKAFEAAEDAFGFERKPRRADSSPGIEGVAIGLGRALRELAAALDRELAHGAVSIREDAVHLDVV
jgi:hypothetical protein